MRRSVLIAALRDKSLWPPNFYWQFSNCSSCAMGLLMRMHGKSVDGGTDAFVDVTAEMLGIDAIDAKGIFCRPAWDAPDYAKSPEKQAAYAAVTPELVAARLEHIHATLSD